MSGKVVEGEYRPSSDTGRISNFTVVIRRLVVLSIPTHSCHRMGAGGAGDPGVRHHAADYFFGDIPCTRGLSEEEVRVSTN